MSRERWGTFSVVDHQHQRAFVADVLLYDRLIIPFPSGAEERARWISIGWDPDRLDQNLKILGNTAIRVPWDQQKRDVFETRFAAAKRAAFDTKNLAHAKQSNLDPFHVTRTLLAHEFLPDLPKGVSKVWPLAAYPSFNKYQEDTALETRRRKKAKERRQEKLVMVLSHRFLVPKDSRKSDTKLLEQAVNLAARDDFKEKRAHFYKWQEDIIENDISDTKAIEEMEESLKKYNEVVRKATTDVYWKFGFLVINVGLGLAGASFGEPISTTTALVNVLSFAKMDRRPKIEANECEHAAFIHDVNKNLKWT